MPICARGHLHLKVLMKQADVSISSFLCVHPFLDKVAEDLSRVVVLVAYEKPKARIRKRMCEAVQEGEQPRQVRGGIPQRTEDEKMQARDGG